MVKLCTLLACRVDLSVLKLLEKREKVKLWTVRSVRIKQQIPAHGHNLSKMGAW